MSQYAPGPPPPLPEDPYLRAHDISSFFRAVFYVYRDQLATVALLTVTPMIVTIPVVFILVIIGVAGGVAVDQMKSPAALAPFILLFIAVIVALAVVSAYFNLALMAATNRAARGEKPTFQQSLALVGFERAVRAFMLMFVMSILSLLALAPLGLAVAVLIGAGGHPGALSVLMTALAGMVTTGLLCAMSVCFLLAMPSCLLEDLGPFESLQRSLELGSGHYLRNFSFILLPGLAMMVLSLVTGGVGQIIVMPAFSIIPVLLYLEMRVRREGPDRVRGITPY